MTNIPALNADVSHLTFDTASPTGPPSNEYNISLFIGSSRRFKGFFFVKSSEWMFVYQLHLKDTSRGGTSKDIMYDETI